LNCSACAAASIDCLIACVEWQCSKPLIHGWRFVSELFQLECSALLMVGSVLAFNYELFDREKNVETKLKQ
jgi:hypothetical protein